MDAPFLYMEAYEVIQENAFIITQHFLTIWVPRNLTITSSLISQASVKVLRWGTRFRFESASGPLPHVANGSPSRGREVIAHELHPLQTSHFGIIADRWWLPARRSSHALNCGQFNSVKTFAFWGKKSSRRSNSSTNISTVEMKYDIRLIYKHEPKSLFQWIFLFSKYTQQFPGY